MEFDIDSFLDKFEEETKAQNGQTFQLEFQKDIETNLEKIKKDALEDNLNLLNSVYATIKNFEQDLPFKFLEISEKSSNILEDLGDKYSQSYSRNITKNAKLFETRILSLLDSIKENIHSHKFQDVFKDFHQIQFLLKRFPEEFYSIKVSLTKKVRFTENDFYRELESFANATLKKFSKDLPPIIKNLKNSLKKKDLIESEKNFSELKIFLKNLPIFLEPFVNKFKSQINNLLNFVEEKIYLLHLEDFQKHLSIINKLITKLHLELLEKDVESSIFLYYTIVNQFHKLDNRFIEQKIKTYQKIIDIFAELNQLILKYNIDLFLNNFEKSKREAILNKLRKHKKEIQKFEEQSKDLHSKMIDNIKKEVQSKEKPKLQFNKNSSLDFETEMKINLIKQKETEFHNLKQNNLKIKEIFKNLSNENPKAFKTILSIMKKIIMTKNEKELAALMLVLKKHKEKLLQNLKFENQREIMLYLNYLIKAHKEKLKKISIKESKNINN